MYVHVLYLHEKLTCVHQNFENIWWENIYVCTALCMCVCVCARARRCACVCVCVCIWYQLLTGSCIARVNQHHWPPHLPSSIATGPTSFPSTTMGRNGHNSTMRIFAVSTHKTQHQE